MDCDRPTKIEIHKRQTMRHKISISILLSLILAISEWQIGRDLKLTKTQALAQSVATANIGSNRIVEIKGEVWLKRRNWSEYSRTSVGTIIYNDDLLQPINGAKVVVLCTDGTRWRLPNDIPSSPNNGCPPISELIDTINGSLILPRPILPRDAGDLTIETNRLIIQDGAEVISTTTGAGNGGNLTINASNLVELAGTSSQLASGLFSESISNGNAGNLPMNTNKLIIPNGAIISATTSGNGNAGRISINNSESGGSVNINAVPYSILSSNQEELIAKTHSGNGGNILIQANGTVNTGNITIKARNFIIGVPNENSDVAANAFTGTGRYMNATSRNVLRFQHSDKVRIPESEISANSSLNILNGTVDSSMGGNLQLNNMRETPPINLRTPYIIRPRSTNLLTTQPILRWTAIPGVKYYKVKIAGVNLSWKTEFSGNEIVYPGIPPLQPGNTYSISVETDNGISLGQEVFTILDRDDAQRVRAAIEQLGKLNLSEEAYTLALSDLYIQNDLRAEAIALLEATLDKGIQTTALYRQLGNLYVHIGIPNLAEATYLKAVELARASGDIEAQILAQNRLGEVYEAMSNLNAATHWLKQAQAGYESLGDAQQVSQIQAQLEKLTTVPRDIVAEDPATSVRSPSQLQPPRYGVPGRASGAGAR